MKFRRPGSDGFLTDVFSDAQIYGNFLILVAPSVTELWYPPQPGELIVVENEAEICLPNGRIRITADKIYHLFDGHFSSLAVLLAFEGKTQVEFLDGALTHISAQKDEIPENYFYRSLAAIASA